ncbi:hypothetical protein FRC11_011649 [Ceratobasidium sp. 423]|nr:hypothetical protein FRC11_011649 [Ceratobasidium sp. 423]
MAEVKATIKKKRTAHIESSSPAPPPDSCPTAIEPQAMDSQQPKTPTKNTADKGKGKAKASLAAQMRQLLSPINEAEDFPSPFKPGPKPQFGDDQRWDSDDDSLDNKILAQSQPSMTTSHATMGQFDEEPPKRKPVLVKSVAREGTTGTQDSKSQKQPGRTSQASTSIGKRKMPEPSHESPDFNQKTSASNASGPHASSHLAASTRQRPPISSHAGPSSSNGSNGSKASQAPSGTSNLAQNSCPDNYHHGSVAPTNRAPPSISNPSKRPPHDCSRSPAHGGYFREPSFSPPPPQQVLSCRSAPSPSRVQSVAPPPHQQSNQPPQRSQSSTRCSNGEGAGGPPGRKSNNISDQSRTMSNSTVSSSSQQREQCPVSGAQANIRNDEQTQACEGGDQLEVAGGDESNVTKPPPSSSCTRLRDYTGVE